MIDANYQLTPLWIFTVLILLVLFLLPGLISVTLLFSVCICQYISIILSMVLAMFHKIKESVPRALRYLISWVCAIPIMLVLVPIFGLPYLYKSALNGLVHLLHPNWKPLSFIDTWNCLEDPYMDEQRYNLNIGYVLHVEGVMDLEEVRTNFLNRVLNIRKPRNPNEYQFERLRKYPIPFYGYYYWSDDIPELNINELIKERVVERSDFEEFLERWTHTSYRAGTPLWELLLYKDNDENKGKTVIMFKMAHCLGDGETLRNILNAFNGTWTPRIISSSLRRSKTFNMREMCILLLKAPYHIYHFLHTIWIGFITEDPMSSYPKADTVSTVRGKMRLKDIKRIRAAYDCKFNDVLLNAMGNMIKGYMLESHPEDKLPESTRIIQLVLIPSEDKMGNQLAAVSVRVPIKCPDPEERLRQLSKHSKMELRVQQRNVDSLYKLGAGILGTMPTFMFLYPGFSKSGPCCGISVMDNVISVNSAFGKYPILSSYPIVGMTFKRTGFVIYFITVRGELLEFVLKANTAMVPTRQGRMVKYLQDGVADMLSLIEK